MRINPIFNGTIKRGKLILDDPNRYLRQIAALEGQDIEVVLRKRKSKRTSPQNRWYWGVVVELLAQHCGYAPEEMHEALKIKFLSEMELDDKGLLKVKSSAGLSTVEFIEYTDRVVRWAAETFSIYIPGPNEVEYP